MGRRDDAPAGLRRRPAHDRRRGSRIGRRHGREAKVGTRVVLDGEVGLGAAPWLDELDPPAPEPACDPPTRRPTYTIESAPVGQALHPLGAYVSAAGARRLRLDDLGQRSSHVPDGCLHPWFLAGRMAPLTRTTSRTGRRSTSAPRSSTAAWRTPTRRSSSARGSSRSTTARTTGTRCSTVSWSGAVARPEQRAGAHPAPLDLPASRHGHAGPELGRRDGIDAGHGRRRVLDRRRDGAGSPRCRALDGRGRRRLVGPAGTLEWSCWPPPITPWTAVRPGHVPGLATHRPLPGHADLHSGGGRQRSAARRVARRDVPAARGRGRRRRAGCPGGAVRMARHRHLAGPPTSCLAAASS